MKDKLKKILDAKMEKGKKKGFTLVELLVVIAIIAVLATVSVVGYLGFTRQAQESVDQQAVTQMNTILQANEVLTEDSSINDMFDVLEENGLTAEDYKPLISNRYFFWDQEENRIIYAEYTGTSTVNNGYEILYPENMVSVSSADHWYSLTGEIQTTTLPSVADGTINISSAAELYTLSEHFSDANSDVNNVSKIYLTKSINMMGGKLELGVMNKAFTIEGSSKDIVLNGVYSNSYVNGGADDNVSGKYAAGIIARTNYDVTFKNFTIDAACIGDYETGSSGILLGSFLAGSGSTLTIDGVTIKNSSIYGKNKIGSLVGYVQGVESGTLNISVKDTTINYTTVYTSEGESGKVFGVIGGGIAKKGHTTLTVSSFSCSSNVNLVLTQTSNRHYFDYTSILNADGTTTTTRTSDFLCSSLYNPNEEQGIVSGDRIWAYCGNESTLKVKRHFADALALVPGSSVQTRVNDSVKYGSYSLALKEGDASFGVMSKFETGTY